MDLSVVITTYNRREILRRTLSEYNLQEKVTGKFEVLVVDDGSDDETGKMVEAVRSELRYPVKYFALPANSGPAAARNVAIKHADGDILFITGDDIIPCPGLLHEHLTWHTGKFAGKNVGVLGLVRWSKELNPTPFMNWLNDGGTQFGYGSLRHGELVDYGYLYTSNISVKKEFIRETGEYFDERLRYYEDSEWGLRLSRKGFDLRFNENARGDHFHRVDLKSSLKRIESVGRFSPTLREISAENFTRATHGLFEPGNHKKYLLVKLLLHPVFGRFIYAPIAGVLERRYRAGPIFAACHASYLLKGIQQAVRDGAKEV